MDGCVGMGMLWETRALTELHASSRELLEVIDDYVWYSPLPASSRPKSIAAWTGEMLLAACSAFVRSYSTVNNNNK